MVGQGGSKVGVLSRNLEGEGKSTSAMRREATECSRANQMKDSQRMTAHSGKDKELGMKKVVNRQ